MKQKFTQEEKQKMVIRHQNGETAANLCLEKCIAKSTFYGWVKILDTAKKDGLKVKDTFKLNQKLEKLEQKFEVLKLVNCTTTSPLKTKLYELEKLHGQYSMYVLCEALDVDRGTLYNHILRNKKQDTSYKKRREDISKLVQEVFDESRQIYGATKISSVLKSRNIVASAEYVRLIMKDLGLASIRTTSKQDYKKLNPKIKSDKIKLNFNVSEPNEVWVSDTTSFKINDKWYYICAIIDLYSRKVIAYKISPKHSTNLVTATFKIAYEERNPTSLIFHSDRGSQFTSNSFMNLLCKLGVSQSFSPSGRPCHNAVIESFFGTLKKEEIYRTNYRSLNEFKSGITRYMSFYNIERPHSYIGYKSPSAYEYKYFEKLDISVPN